MVLVVLFLASAVQVAVARADVLPADAAFRVEGTVVTIAQLQHQTQVLTGIYGVQRPSDKKQIPAFTKSVAKALAVSDILYKEATKRGIAIADKTANDNLNTLVQQDFPTGQGAFTAKLKSLGISQVDVLDQIKRELANSQLYDQVTKKVPGTTVAAAQAYYDANKAQIVSPEQRHLANIVVASKDQAQQILQQLQTGASLAALAQQYSLDGSTKNNGGDVGTVAESQLGGSYAQAAFSASPMGFFGPVQSQYGWNIGQVLGVTPSMPLTFDQAKQQLQTQLRNQQQLKVWDAWVAAQIRHANVTYADTYRPANPNAAPTGQP